LFSSSSFFLISYKIELFSQVDTEQRKEKERNEMK